MIMPGDKFGERRTWGPEPRYPKVRSYRPTSNDGPIVVAGPCSVESEEQIDAIMAELSKWHVSYIRGGVFRAGTYPGESFGMIPVALLDYFHRAAHAIGCKVVLEVLDYRKESLDLYEKYSDAYQVGARHMQNYTLLRLLGRSGRRVFLKRHHGATLDEFLGAAEHLLTGGNCHPVLVERGGVTHLNHVRWDLSISLIAAVRALTAMPIIVDASHGTGRRDLVLPMTLAGMAAGASGFLVEVHPNPVKSLSDADQAFPLGEFGALCKRAIMVGKVVNAPMGA